MSPASYSAAAVEQIAEEESDRRSSPLSQLAEQLERFPSSSTREEFALTFRSAIQILEVADDELADRFGVSRPTIGRWARGESAPHPLGRPPIMKVLKKIAKQKFNLQHRVLVTAGDW